MFYSIVSVIGFAAILFCVGVALFNLRRAKQARLDMIERNTEKDGSIPVWIEERYRNLIHSSVGEPSITAASIFGVWVLVNIPFALFYITPASIGLETTIGGVTTGTVYQPGYHWSKPWTVVYEGTVTTPISFEVNTQVITQENQTVNLSAFSIVQITPDAVPDLFRIGLIEWGGDLNILAGIRLSELMKNAVKRGLYTYGQGKPLNDIRAETEKLAPVIQDELNKSLEQYGLGAPIKVTKAQVTGVSEQVRFVVKER